MPDCKGIFAEAIGSNQEMLVSRGMHVEFWQPQDVLVY